MDDLISRQEAIDALFELYEYQRDIDPTQAADLVRQGIYLAEKKIEQLPSAQTEWKKGNWVYGEDEYGIDGYHCDKCGFFVPWDYAHKFISYIEDYNFCPSCGADMRGEEG